MQKITYYILEINPYCVYINGIHFYAQAMQRFLKVIKILKK